MNRDTHNTQDDPQLDSLLREMRRTHRARKSRALVAVTALLLLAITLPVLMTQGTPTQQPHPVPLGGAVAVKPAPDAPMTPPDEQSPGNTAPIDTPRPSIITVSNKRSPTIVRTISDDELLDALNTSGRRTGLIRTGDAVILDADWLTNADDSDTQQEESGLSPTPPTPTA